MLSCLAARQPSTHSRCRPNRLGMKKSHTRIFPRMHARSPKIFSGGSSSRVNRCWLCCLAVSPTTSRREPGAASRSRLRRRTLTFSLVTMQAFRMHSASRRAVRSMVRLRLDFGSIYDHRLQGAKLVVVRRAGGAAAALESAKTVTAPHSLV